jgi:hypothetical protein
VIVPSDSSQYYEITTTASVAGVITVCVNYDEGQLTLPENTLDVMHWSDGLSEWELITTAHDTETNTICGEVTSLSPFVLVEPACGCPYQADIEPDGFVTSLDLAACIDILFASATDIRDESCPSPRFDLDCDTFTTSLDLANLIDHLYASGSGPCDPCSQ